MTKIDITLFVNNDGQYDFNSAEILRVFDGTLKLSAIYSLNSLLRNMDFETADGGWVEMQLVYDHGDWRVMDWFTV